jgi:hypothetical protein
MKTTGELLLVSVTAIAVAPPAQLGSAHWDTMPSAALPNSLSLEKFPADPPRVTALTLAAVDPLPLSATQTTTQLPAVVATPNEPLRPVNLADWTRAIAN